MGRVREGCHWRWLGQSRTESRHGGGARERKGEGGEGTEVVFFPLEVNQVKVVVVTFRELKGAE